MSACKSRKVAWIPVECLVDTADMADEKLHLNLVLLEALKKANFDSIYVFSDINHSSTPHAKKIRKKFLLNFNLRLHTDIIAPFYNQFLPDKKQISISLELEEEFVDIGSSKVSELAEPRDVAPPADSVVLASTQIVIEEQSIVQRFEMLANCEVRSFPVEERRELESKQIPEPPGTFYFFGTQAIDPPMLINMLTLGRNASLKKYFRFESVCLDSETTTQRYLENFGDEHPLESYKEGFNSYQADIVQNIDKLTSILKEFQLDLLKYFNNKILNEKKELTQAGLLLDSICKIELRMAKKELFEGFNEELNWPENHRLRKYADNKDAIYLLVIINKLSNYIDALKQERRQISMDSYELKSDYIQQLELLIKGILHQREKDDDLQKLLSKATDHLFLQKRSIETNSPLIIGRKPIGLSETLKNHTAQIILDNKQTHSSEKIDVKSLKKHIKHLEDNPKYDDLVWQEKLSNAYKDLFTQLIEAFQGSEINNKTGTKQTYLEDTGKRNLRGFFGFAKRDSSRDISIRKIDDLIKKLSADEEISDKGRYKEKYIELLDMFVYQKLLTNTHHTSQVTHLFFRTESHLERAFDKMLVDHISFVDWKKYEARFQNDIQNEVSRMEQAQTNLVTTALGATIKFIFALFAIWMVASDFFTV